MSRVIRISQENYERLKRFAVPLSDTRDDVIGRVLGLAELAAQNEAQPEPPEKDPDEVEAPEGG